MLRAILVFLLALVSLPLTIVYFLLRAVCGGKRSKPATKMQARRIDRAQRERVLRAKQERLRVAVEAYNASPSPARANLVHALTLAVRADKAALAA